MNPKKELEFRGIDSRGVPFSFFKKVTSKIQGKPEVLKGEPFKIDPSKKGTIEIEFYRFLG